MSIEAHEMNDLDALTAALLELKREQPQAGKPRQIAVKDRATTTWRQLTIGGETFRVLTIEDE